MLRPSVSMTDLPGMLRGDEANSSHLNDQSVASNPSNNYGTSKLCPDILGMHKRDINAFLGAREDKGNT